MPDDPDLEVYKAPPSRTPVTESTSALPNPVTFIQTVFNYVIDAPVTFVRGTDGLGHTGLSAALPLPSEGPRRDVGTGASVRDGGKDTATGTDTGPRGHKDTATGTQGWGLRCWGDAVHAGVWHRQWDRRTELSTHRAVRCLTVPLLLQSGSSASKPRTSPITTTRSFAVCPT